MAIDNPKDLVELIIDDVSGKNRFVFQPAPPRVQYVDKNENPLQEEEYDEILLYYTDKKPIIWTPVEKTKAYARSTLRLDEDKQSYDKNYVPQEEDADLYGEEDGN